MKTKISDFDFEIQGQTIVGKQNQQYIYNNVDIFNTINIDDVDYIPVYQTGMYYEMNDINCPTNNIELSEEGGTDEMLLVINDVDIDDKEAIELIGRQYALTEREISNIKTVLMYNTFEAEKVLLELGLSDDVTNYKLDEDELLVSK